MLRKNKRQYTKDNTRQTNLLLKQFGDLSYGKHQIKSYPSADDDGPLLTSDGMLFDSSNSEYLEIADSDDWNITSDDWTLSFWVKSKADGVAQCYIAHCEDDSNYWACLKNTSNNIQFRIKIATVNYIELSAGTLTESENWVKIDICKVGNNYGLYKNGTQIAYDSDSITTSLSGTLNIGKLNTQYFANAYLRDIHICRDNKYGANPVVGLTDTITPELKGKMQLFANTLLALPLSGDESNKQTNINLAQTIVNYGDQFKGGKYCEFDGVGDYLTVVDSALGLDTSDWTFDCIISFASPTTAQRIVDKEDDTNNRVFFSKEATQNNFYFQAKSSSVTLAAYTFISPIDIVADTFYHIAYQRNGTTMECYVNGRACSVTETTAIGTSSIPELSADLHIGTRTGNISDIFTGNMKALRLTKQRLWTEEFIPPKELKKINNSVLFLENFNEINAGRFSSTQSDNMVITNHSDFYLTTNNFTFHFWAKSDTDGTVGTVFNIEDSTYDGIRIFFDTDNKFKITLGDGEGEGYDVTFASPLAYSSDDKFHHYALTRSSSNFYMYIDGIYVATVSSSFDIPSFSSNVYIGSSVSSTNYFEGSVKNFVFENGIARWVGEDSFTPPVEYKDYIIDSYTKLFLPFEYDIAYDISPSNHSITNNGVSIAGNPTYVDKSGYLHSIYKWGNPLIKNIHQGDIRFDGSVDYLEIENDTNNVAYFNAAENDYLSIPDSTDWDLGSNNITIDCYIKFSKALTSTQRILMQGEDDSNWWALYWNPTNGIIFRSYIDSADEVYILQGSNTGWVVGTWYHLAVVRNGSNWNIYRDGISIANGTDSSSLSNLTATLCIAEHPNFTSQNSFGGYLKNVRIFNGEALWLSSFTPPQTKKDYAKQFNDNCVLWLKMNDATDSSRSSHTPTNSGASFARDLDNPYLKNLDIRDNDFTIECWVKFDALTVNQVLMSNWDAAGDQCFILQYVQATNNIEFIGRSSAPANFMLLQGATTTIATDVWYHIAVVRNGSNGYLFINGIIDASDTSSNGIICSSNNETLIGSQYNSYTTKAKLFDGSLKNIRIEVDKARYKHNFIPEII